jgi:hypothetical protein
MSNPLFKGDESLPAIYALRDWFFVKYFSTNTEGFKGYLIPAQKEVSNNIIHAVVSPPKGKSAEEIFIEFSRQSGKTTVTVLTMCFLMVYFKDITGRRLRAGIFAPQKEQAKTDFDRLKESLAIVKFDYNLEFDEYNANTITLSSTNRSEKDKVIAQCVVFPITETSNPESKTLDILIFEEAHLLTGKRERKMKTSVFPMGASTNAPRIFIGTAGTQICYFYNGLNDPAKRSYEYPYELIIKQRRELYELTGDEELLKYESFVLGEKDRLGEDSDEFKAPYRLIWILGTGQFITKAKLEALMDPEVSLVNSERSSWHFVGIDTAKHPDSTVATVLRWNEKRKVKELLFWLQIRGENYQDQFYMLERLVLGVQRDEKNQIIRDNNSYIKYSGGFKVRSIAIDSTGQGDFMPDMFERNTEFDCEENGLYRIRFSLPEKDKMYKTLKVQIDNKLTRLPKSAILESSKEYQEFLKQVIALQREYKGGLLSVHHPDDPNAHDDYPDSWALAEYAYAKEQEKPEPEINII